jgi:pimeloyl-ACP methyl ester carboxylesterase
MANANDDYHVVGQGAAVTHASRANDRPVAMPRDLPGIVIFLHGVNDPGAVYSFVEEGLCHGLNDRLSRDDLKSGLYGAKYQALAKKPKADVRINDESILGDPDTYLYHRTADKTTNSVLIPFYWGYRADDSNIAKLNNPGKVKSRAADPNGNLMTRGQYQDLQGNRLDKHFAKAGGFFANATNNIPDMYERGFVAGKDAQFVTWSNIAGNYLYAANAPDRTYFVLAATRLANLIFTIRAIKAKDLAAAQGMLPEHETITIMGHSQGTILTLLAQAILKEKGHRCVDTIIMVDTPYGLYETADSSQTGHAKLKTLIDIVNEVTQKPYTVPDLADMLIEHDRHGGRAGPGWTKTQGKRLDKSGKNWITFDERDNRGKVYLYFCPEDTVVGLKSVHGIGTFGVPDEVPADGAALKANPKKKTMPAMTALSPKRFFQRMWTRMERDHNGDGKYKKILVGTKPARVPVREQFERLSPGPDIGSPASGFFSQLGGSAASQAQNVALQAKFERNDIRFINGEELKPPCEPDLYGGEVVRGGPKPGYADVPGVFSPDDVTKDVALGNQYASLRWVTVEHSMLPELDLEKLKTQFNADKSPDQQSHNWKVGGIGGFAVLREETPEEARARMAKDSDAYDANNYHSGVLHSAENHRWVTAMDVAIGQAVMLDDPVWRDLLIGIADWKLGRVTMAELKANKNYDRLPDETKQLVEACANYYQAGTFPEDKISMVPPSLVTSELTPKETAAQQAAQQEQWAQEQRFMQDQVAKNWGQL